MAQHTPGPWVVQRSSEPLQFRAERIEVNGAGAPIAYCVDGGTSEEQEANARAISALPDLLDYVRRCASNCPEANELLKKVEGSNG